MLDANIQTQLKAYLEKLQNPIELIASLDDSAKAAEIRSLLNDIAALSDKVSVSENGTATLRPSFGVARVGEPARVQFAGIPMGHEFTSLVLALLQVRALEQGSDTVGLIFGRVGWIILSGEGAGGWQEDRQSEQ